MANVGASLAAQLGAKFRILMLRFIVELAADEFSVPGSHFKWIVDVWFTAQYEHARTGNGIGDQKECAPTLVLTNVCVFMNAQGLQEAMTRANDEMPKGDCCEGQTTQQLGSGG